MFHDEKLIGWIATGASVPKTADLAGYKAIWFDWQPRV